MRNEIIPEPSNSYMFFQKQIKSHIYNLFEIRYITYELHFFLIDTLITTILKCS